jgi:hypothetical protein
MSILLTELDDPKHYDRNLISNSHDNRAPHQEQGLTHNDKYHLARQWCPITHRTMHIIQNHNPWGEHAIQSLGKLNRHPWQGIKNFPSITIDDS